MQYNMINDASKPKKDGLKLVAKHQLWIMTAVSKYRRYLFFHLSQRLEHFN